LPSPKVAARKRTRELADLANTKNLNGARVAQTDLDEAAAGGGGGGQVGRQLAMSHDELLTTTKVGVPGQARGRWSNAEQVRVSKYGRTQ
jgi:hypothetical protein